MEGEFRISISISKNALNLLGLHYAILVGKKIFTLDINFCEIILELCFVGHEFNK